nr:hypothetical protein [Candidatus Litorirhabdus singularis]
MIFSDKVVAITGVGQAAFSVFISQVSTQCFQALTIGAHIADSKPGGRAHLDHTGLLIKQ